MSSWGPLSPDYKKRKEKKGIAWGELEQGLCRNGQGLYLGKGVLLGPKSVLTNRYEKKKGKEEIVSQQIARKEMR